MKINFKCKSCGADCEIDFLGKIKHFIKKRKELEEKGLCKKCYIASKKAEKKEERYCQLVDAEILRETEKAIFCDLTVDTHLSLRSKKVWLPKSQIKIEDKIVKIKEWFLNQKEKEIEKEIGSFAAILIA